MYYKRKALRRNSMKPRIFVSSTFYDLKYIREDLSNFIKAHDFEPIMFEDGDIGYTPGKPLDESCYKTMHSADMVLLIIGGTYGSPATGEVKEDFTEYMSVTRNEFKSAIDEGVPVYAFVDNKVYVEYEVYEANIKSIETDKKNINFRNVKDVNVFRFIKEIKNVGNIPITEFSKIMHIKEFLSKQWSEMFKKYLDALKEEKSDKRLEDTVDDMKTLIKKMDIMLDGIGKKVLDGENSPEYTNVLEIQEIVELCEKISSYFGMMDKIESEELRKDCAKKLIDAIKEALNNNMFVLLGDKNEDKVRKIFEFFSDRGVKLRSITQGFELYKTKFEKVYRNNESLLIEELSKKNYWDKMYRDYAN